VNVNGLGAAVPSNEFELVSDMDHVPRRLRVQHHGEGRRTPDSVVGPEIDETEIPATSSSAMVTVAALGVTIVYAAFAASVRITVSLPSATESPTGVTRTVADAAPTGMLTLVPTAL